MLGLLDEVRACVGERADADPSEGLRRIDEHLGVAHPELSDDALRALKWHFSYSHR